MLTSSYIPLGRLRVNFARTSSYLPQPVLSQPRPQFGNRLTEIPGAAVRRYQDWPWYKKTMAIAGITAVGLGGGAVYKVHSDYQSIQLPDPVAAAEQSVKSHQSTEILAKDGKRLKIDGKFKHVPVEMAEVPENFVQALLATEDREFLEHDGINWLRVTKAGYENLKSGGIAEGGSTITQQLVKTIYLNSEQSWSRKYKEALIAMKLEDELGGDNVNTKQQILELYINTVFFGEGSYGLGAASRVFFNKPPKDLTVEESALLVAMLKGPTAYNPYGNPEDALARRNLVLSSMVEVGYLSKADYERLSQLPLNVNPNAQRVAAPNTAPYFTRHVVNEATEILGIDEQTFWQENYKIITSLDPKAQRLAEEQLKAVNEANGRTDANEQASLVSVDDRGRIIAYAGGKDFNETQFDHNSQAIRSPGSSFKPIVYAAALKYGIVNPADPHGARIPVTPSTVYTDAPVDIDGWQPSNYDNAHHGSMTLLQAMVESNNVIAAKLARDVTPEKIVELAKAMGVQSSLEPVPSLALGSTGVTPLDMVAAYSTINNGGMYYEPSAVSRIEDAEGNVIYENKREGVQVLDEQTSDTMISMLRGVVTDGTGKGAAIGAQPVAGKTGTGEDYKDAWFSGFAPGVTTTVWMGNQDNSPMDGITGGSLPASIWSGFMAGLFKERPVQEFDLQQALTADETSVAPTEAPEEESIPDPAPVPAPVEGGLVPGAVSPAPAPAPVPDSNAVSPAPAPAPVPDPNAVSPAPAPAPAPAPVPDPALVAPYPPPVG